MKTLTTIDAYIESFPQPVAVLLKQLRQIIQHEVPSAKEAIKYGIPTYVLNGNLVHFGGFQKHVSLYPGAEAIEVFKPELKTFVISKGTIQFPLDQPLPVALIKRIVQYRVKASTKN